VTEHPSRCPPARPGSRPRGVSHPLKAATVTAGLTFPHAAQALCLARVAFPSPGRGRKRQVNNGIPADQLAPVSWRKSRVSNPSGSCAEVAELPGGAIAVRNSRHPSGPALIYTHAEVAAFLMGVKNGEFDDLCPGGGCSVLLLPEAVANGGPAVR
jgi:Domain of unknown function (DUF397)